MKRIISALLLLLLFDASANAAQLPACTAGSTTCSNDTSNDASLVNAINDPGFKQRVQWLWDQQCANVFSEAGSTAGHIDRVNFCQLIDREVVPVAMLVQLVLNSTVVSEILAGTAPQGNAVDADINNAISAALTLTSASASTTATQAVIGATTLTVASATGIVPGQTVFAAGVPGGAKVVSVSGTTVSFSGPGITAALSATPVTFFELSGLASQNGG